MARSPLTYAANFFYRFDCDLGATLDALKAAHASGYIDDAYRTKAINYACAMHIIHTGDVLSVAKAKTLRQIRKAMRKSMPRFVSEATLCRFNSICFQDQMRYCRLVWSETRASNHAPRNNRFMSALSNARHNRSQAAIHGHTLDGARS